MPRSLTLAVLAVLALLLTACPAPDETVSPDPPEPEETPEPTPEPEETPEPTPEPDGETEATAFFVRDEASARMGVEPASAELDEPTVGVGRAAMKLLVSGDVADPNLMTLAPEGTEVLDVRIEDGVMVVDLSEDVMTPALGSSGELAFSQQLAHTAAQFDGVDAVMLLVEGDETGLWGHVDWTQPIAPDPNALSPIIIESPAWNAELPAGPVTVSGTSLTFEANVVLELYDPDGELVEETFTTATQPDIDQRGPFSHTFEAEADRPGRWRIDAIAADAAGPDEGPGDFVTTVQFDVT
jgi:hypothetical protein